MLPALSLTGVALLNSGNGYRVTLQFIVSLVGVGRRVTRVAKRLPRCGKTFDDLVCTRSGDHICKPRSAHLQAFFSEILVHTKGRWARQPFHLSTWQVRDIMEPLFATVAWSAESGRYVRRYRLAWIEVARKNGKSELLAGIALYLLIADDEEGAEIYGCAMDRDQARKVFDVAERMVHLSPLLSSRLRINKQAKRIYDSTTGSYYEALASDASGNLGHNPHGIVFDEVLTQKNADLWNAMRTGMGARDQPLMVAATTAGDDPQSFAKNEHDEMRKIAEDPDRAPHIFVYLRNIDMDADPWDESLWHLANPALGEFLSMQSLRDEAREARNDPGKENAFRQFRLNQWVSQSSRWMPMHLWDKCTGDLWLNPQWHNNELTGRTAYAGFDLAAKFDLTAWAIVIPGQEPNEDPAHILWRFWLPESGLERLDQLHDGKFSRWARQGWLTVTEGSVIDYEKVIDDIAQDAKTYRIVAADCDEWSMWPVINRISEALNLDVEQGELTAYRNTYDRMSPGMTDLMGTVKRGLLRHHGNPVARFCFDQCEVRHAPYDPNLIRPEKPERARDKARIDAVPAAAMAVNAWKSREGVDQYQSAYEDNKLMVI
jgi:phage terminase large subunit-like protein